MKKIIITVVIIAALLFAVTPNFIGQRAETEFKNLYSQIDNSQEFSVAVTDYQRGWFSSTAVVELVVDLTQFDPQATEQIIFKLQNEISHGPLLTEVKAMELGLVDINSRIEFPDVMLKEMPEFNESFNELVTIQNRMYFDGSMFGLVEMQEFEFKDTDVNLTISPAKFEAITSAQGRILSTGFWDGMSISDNGTFGITFGKMLLDFDMTSLSGNLYDTTGIYTGTSNMSIAEMRMTGQELPGVIVLNDITLDSKSSVADELLSFDINMGVSEIDAMGMSFTQLEFNQTFSNLDIKALQEMNAFLSAQTTDEQLVAQMGELTRIAMTLLEKQPVYEMRQLGVMTAQGAINSSMTARLDQDLVDPANIESVAQAIILNASGTIPEAFLTSLGIMPMVQPFVDQGYLTKDTDNLAFEFTYQQGQMSLSGKPFPMAPTQ